VNYGITDLTAFVLGTILIVLLPGPNSLYVMTAAARNDLRAGYWAGWGIVVGDTLLMLLTALGAASALQASPTMFAAIRIIGALYLAWLGVGLIRDAIHRWKAKDPTVSSQSLARGNFDHPFRSALIISLLNPKAIMFFVSFFVQFVDPNYPHPGLTFLMLGLIVQFFSVIYLLGLIHGGTRLAASFGQYRRLALISTVTVGLLFIGFALRLAI